MQLSLPRLRHLEVAAIVLVLIGIGVVRFSRLSPEQAREVELRAGMEQLHQLEADYFGRYRRYFNPTASEYRRYLPWMDTAEHEVRWNGTSYAVTVQADLDGDGEKGVWRVSDTSPEVTRLVDD